jgi:hypothetical protein
MKKFGVAVVIIVVINLVSAGLSYLFNVTMYEAMTLLIAGMLAGIYSEVID